MFPFPGNSEDRVYSADSFMVWSANVNASVAVLKHGSSSIGMRLALEHLQGSSVFFSSVSEPTTVK